MDLQQQLAVNQQGVLATALIIRNNRELVRGVDRAIDVTISALQVAVAVAMAVAHQKVVLDKVEALNRTTSDMIAGTAATPQDAGHADPPAGLEHDAGHGVAQVGIRGHQHRPR